MQRTLCALVTLTLIASPGCLWRFPAHGIVVVTGNIVTPSVSNCELQAFKKGRNKPFAIRPVDREFREDFVLVGARKVTFRFRIQCDNSVFVSETYARTGALSEAPIQLGGIDLTELPAKSED